MNVKKLSDHHNGYQTWSFSQAHLSTWIHYRTMGICAALAAHWIRDHAHDGSLVNELGSGGVGPLNTGKLREIAHDHRTWSTQRASSQDAQVALWLSNNGIDDLKTSGDFSMEVRTGSGRVIRHSATPDNMLVYEGVDSKRFRPMIEVEIVNALARYQSCYARIGFGGRLGGHAVAVWLGHGVARQKNKSFGDACFFDPNYGEYWFEKKQDFFKFFADFYRAKYKRFPYYFGYNWDVVPCAKRVL